MKPAADLSAELRRAYLFAELSESHVARLLEDTRELKLQPGETLFRHGEPAGHFYFLRQGLVKLFRLSPEGDEKIIEIIRPGETFAEAVMFMGTKGRYPVNAEAVSEARLLAFSQSRFLGMLREMPEASFSLLASMSRRLHMLVNQIESLTLQNATYRLVTYLLEQLPGGSATAPEIQLSVPKSVIAARLAIQPETLSRILARLRQGGLVEVHGAHIAVRDVQALRKLVHMPPERDTPA
jgi:CRP-like cAMP-binding protein